MRSVKRRSRGGKPTWVSEVTACTHSTRRSAATTLSFHTTPERLWKSNRFIFFLPLATSSSLVRSVTPILLESLWGRLLLTRCVKKKSSQEINVRGWFLMRRPALKPVKEQPASWSAADLSRATCSCRAPVVLCSFYKRHRFYFAPLIKLTLSLRPLLLLCQLIVHPASGTLLHYSVRPAVLRSSGLLVKNPQTEVVFWTVSVREHLPGR